MSLHKNTVKLSVGNTTKSKFKMAHQIHSTNPTDANHKKKKTIATFTTKKKLYENRYKQRHFTSTLQFPIKQNNFFLFCVNNM